MQINGVQFNCDLGDILRELQSQLALNRISLLQKIKDSGDDYMVQCPYHSNGQEIKPSAGIRKKDGKFHCFACNEVHELQEVISYCFGHYEDAFGNFGWKWLNKNFSSVEVENRTDVNLDFSRANHNNRIHSLDSKNYVSEEELDSYRYFHPYMYKRRLTDEIIEKFDIGFDKNTQCITFPVRDINGNTLFIARRSVKTKFFNYPEGVEKPLYGLYELYQNSLYGDKNSNAHILGYPYSFPKEVIVCESMLDALTAWTYDKYAVALNGLGNELQFKQLRELPCRKLILATDNDKAGLEARKRIRENVKNKLITEYQFPEGKKDLNELDFAEFENLLEVF